MSYTSSRKTNVKPNFIASAVGMVQQTRNFTDAGITADEYGYKTVPAGTIYPANDATAEGVVFEDVDVTDGAHAGSLVVAGRLYSNRLPTAPSEAAKTAMLARGLYFETVPETTREDV